MFSNVADRGATGNLGFGRCDYCAAADGFALIDRPVMLSMTLDVVADFDGRACDYGAAARVVDQAIANDACGLRGFTESLLARLGWALLHEGDPARVETTYQRALDRAHRPRNVPVMFLALAGRPCCIASAATRRTRRHHSCPR